MQGLPSVPECALRTGRRAAVLALASFVLGVGGFMALPHAAAQSRPNARQAPLQIAAAADLSVCMPELNAAFGRENPGIETKFTIGASGNFFAQIRNGAPYDVFLSADLFYPRELAKAGLADESTLFTYAHGRLVLWTADPKFDVSGGLRILADPAVTRIAIANPEVAPYGRAAKAALERAGLWDAVRPKLVFGENVAQTMQFVQTGNAKVGLVGGAHVAALGEAARAQSWTVPADAYPLLEQGAIVTKNGASHSASARYLEFLRSESGRAVLRKYGFTLPGVANR